MRNRSVSRTAPRSRERDHAAPPSAVPTTTSAEPPPTSQTATLAGSQPDRRDRADEREPPFLVRRQNSNRSSRGGRERADELAPIRALPAGRRDDHLDRTGPELHGRFARMRLDTAGRIVDARRREAAVPLDLLAEEQMLPLLLQRHENHCPRRRATSRRMVLEPTRRCPTFIDAFFRWGRLETRLARPAGDPAPGAGALCA